MTQLPPLLSSPSSVVVGRVVVGRVVVEELAGEEVAGVAMVVVVDEVGGIVDEVGGIVEEVGARVEVEGGIVLVVGGVAEELGAGVGAEGSSEGQLPSSPFDSIPPHGTNRFMLASLVCSKRSLSSLFEATMTSKQPL